MTTCYWCHTMPGGQEKCFSCQLREARRGRLGEARRGQLDTPQERHQDKVDDVLKFAQQLDEWVGMMSIRFLAQPAHAAEFARRLMKVRTALRRLDR